jgi:hypothetical protein
MKTLVAAVTICLLSSAANAAAAPFTVLPALCNNRFEQLNLTQKAACLFPNDANRQIEWITQIELARASNGTTFTREK